MTVTKRAVESTKRKVTSTQRNDALLKAQDKRCKLCLKDLVLEQAIFDHMRARIILMAGYIHGKPPYTQEQFNRAKLDVIQMQAQRPEIFRKIPPSKYYPALSKTKAWEVDHIIPLQEGGSNDISNLQILCTICHKTQTKLLRERIAYRRKKDARN